MTASAANRSGLPLAGLALTVTLPAGLTYVPGSAPGLASDATGQQLTAALPALAAGAAITGAFRARPDEVAAGTLLTTTLTALAAGLTAPLTVTNQVEVVAPEGTDEGKVTGLLAPAVLGAGPELWTGDAGFSYPLELPAGPGGFTPQLSLSYSGGGVNDLVRAVGVNENKLLLQGGYAGLGWSVGGLGSITLVDDTYYLSFAGGSYELKQDAAESWHTVPESFLRITHTVNDVASGSYEYAYGGGECVLWKASKKAHNTAPWVVEAPDGTRYTFGSALDVKGNPLESGATPYKWTGQRWCDPSSCVADPPVCGKVQKEPYAWHLTKMEDTTGNNSIEYHYDHESRRIANADDCPGLWEVIPDQYYVRESFPTIAEYGNVIVTFESEARGDNPQTGTIGCTNQRVYSDKRLQNVTITVANQFLRRYDLASHVDTQLLLDSITLLGHGGQSLPPMTFDYVQWGGPNARFLHTVNNGYGGGATLDYVAESANIPDPVGCKSLERYVVGTRTVSSGVGPAALWRYDYGTGASVGQCVGGNKYEFLGFDQVTETVRTDGSSQVWRQRMAWFHQKDAGGSADVRKGKRYRETVGDGTTVLQDTTWNWDAVGDWPQLTSATVVVDGAGQRTAYQYDGYGNVTHVREYDSPTAATPYRTTERSYYPQTAAGQRYLVDRLAEERLWQGEVGGSCRRQTRYTYDDASGVDGYTLPPTQGLLREEWHAGQMGLACDADWVRTAYYEYDGWGNRRLARAANGTDTTTVYDGDPFHAHPLSVTIQPPADQGSTLTTSYRYYGINAESWGSGLTGQLQSTTDANGAVTRYSYDAFGRATELRRPGAEWTHPATEQYAYTDSLPFTVRHGLRDDPHGDISSAATYLEDWVFYDGLGQAIQTQGESAAAGQSRIVHTGYDSLGRVVQQTAPYFYPAAPGAYRAPASADWAGRTTTSSYDALGRVTAVTHPDGTAVRSFYSGRLTARLDENNHQTLQEIDAFGRLVHSWQYEGVFATPGWGAAAYAWATYAYNGRDQVTDVWDTAGHHTAIGYDLLGRKTSLSDPDMGSWSYGYDAAGNLTRQTDARGVTVWFGYDGLQPADAEAADGRQWVGLGGVPLRRDGARGGRGPAHGHDGLHGRPGDQQRKLGLRSAGAGDERDPDHRRGRLRDGLQLRLGRPGAHPDLPRRRGGRHHL